MKTIEFYKSFLKSLGYDFDNDLLVFASTEAPAFFTYNKVKRRLALPTSTMIKNGMEDTDGAECHAFHPLCESVLAGESGTIRFLKKAITTNILLRSFELITAIIETAAEGKTVRNASYKKFIANYVCAGVKEPVFDKKLLTSWNAVESYVNEFISNKDGGKRNKATSIFIASNVEVDGVKFVRAANYRHMFEEEGQDGTATYFGCKLQRKSDKIIIHNLLDTIFNWYPAVCGSNDNRPYFGCLARGWAQFVVNYNNVVGGLRDHTGLRRLDDEWIGQLDNLSIYDGVIQTLPYNTGPKEDVHTEAKQEFRLTSTPTAPSLNSIPAANKTEESGDDPMSFFRRMNATNSQSSALGINRALMNQVQMESYDRTGKLNATESRVNRISVAEALGQEPRPKSPTAGLGSLLQQNSFTTFSSGGLCGGGLSGGGLSGSNGGLGSLLGGNQSDPFSIFNR